MIQIGEVFKFIRWLFIKIFVGNVDKPMLMSSAGLLAIGTLTTATLLGGGGLATTKMTDETNRREFNKNNIEQLQKGNRTPLLFAKDNFTFGSLSPTSVEQNVTFANDVTVKRHLTNKQQKEYNRIVNAQAPQVKRFMQYQRAPWYARVFMDKNQ